MLKTLELMRGPQTLIIWMSRPEVRNALDGRMVAELTEVFAELAEDDEVQAVVLGARGPAFCAGADLAWLQGASGGEAPAESLGRLFEAVYRCPKPVIARVPGPGGQLQQVRP